MQKRVAYHHASYRDRQTFNSVMFKYSTLKKYWLVRFGKWLLRLKCLTLVACVKVAQKSIVFKLLIGPECFFFSTQNANVTRPNMTPLFFGWRAIFTIFGTANKRNNQSRWLCGTDVTSPTAANINNRAWQAHYLCLCAPSVVLQTRYMADQLG